MERIYLQDHLKFLMDKMLESYIRNEYAEFERIKKQIYQLRSIMNSHDYTTLNDQKLKILVDL
jgi:hypothetical protein